jgi:hypothetical protein
MSVILGQTAIRSRTSRRWSPFNGAKVPLSIAWLLENGLLVQTAEIVRDWHGSPLKAEVVNKGVLLSWTEDGLTKTEELGFDDNFLLTLSQLLELGFDTGDEAAIMSRLLR